MNEAETRAEHIDPALKAAGWGVVEGSRIRREYPIAPGRIEGHGKRGKALTADYVLEYRNTKLGVVEAKALDEELTEGVGQAKNYAGKLAVRFAYSTNGQGIYQVDMSPDSHSSHPPEREIAAYPTPDELWAMTFAEANAWRDRFALCVALPVSVSVYVPEFQLPVMPPASTNDSVSPVVAPELMLTVAPDRFALSGSIVVTPVSTAAATPFSVNESVAPAVSVGASFTAVTVRVTVLVFDTGAV